MQGYTKLFVATGLSPHTRDKWKDLLSDCLSDGITPAYAGQISLVLPCQLLSEDHPRIRGTNGVLRIAIFATEGSSPHTRDKFLTVL